MDVYGRSCSSVGKKKIKDDKTRMECVKIIFLNRKTFLKAKLSDVVSKMLEASIKKLLQSGEGNFSKRID